MPSQRSISNPILQLTDVVQTVSNLEEYSIRAHKESHDELGLLIDSFNDTLMQIQARDVAMVRSNEELEARMEERTGALNFRKNHAAIWPMWKIRIAPSAL